MTFYAKKCVSSTIKSLFFLFCRFNYSFNIIQLLKIYEVFSTGFCVYDGFDLIGFRSKH